MSIKQRIASDIYRMADNAVTPDQIKSIQAHVIKGVQTGTVPSYVGVPLLNDLNQKMARIQTAPAQAQAMVQQPPIAQQVMGQAEQGVETLPSGLPAEGMAGGGIVAFADGGMSDYEMADYLLADEDEDDADYVNAMLGDLANQEARYAREEEDGGTDGLMATRARESVSMQSGNEPAKGVTRERTSVTGPAGLESLLKMIEQKESGGRGDYDEKGRLLTSPAGAQGRMQVMPGTSRDPGFGIRPAREGDVEDLARVGREYYTKMLERYDDPKIAAIAYNWGPGNTDKWLSSGADMKKLPAETRNYVANMAEGGAVRFSDRGLVDISNMTPDEIKEAMRRRIKMEGARETFTKVPEAPKAPAAARVAPSAASDLTYGQRLMRFLSPSGGAAGPAAGIGALGGALSYGAANQMGNLSSEQREQLMGDIGSDTGFAAAIMNEATPGGWSLNPFKEKTPVEKPAAQQRMPVTSSNISGQSYKRTQGPTKEGMEEAELLSGVDQGFDPKQFSPRPEAEAGTQQPKEDAIRSMLDKSRADIGKQREIDNYMSLLSAGLGMMGGTSQYGLANIGQGAQQGVRTYQQAAQLRGADERALMSGELGFRKYKALEDIRKAGLDRQKLSDEANLQLRRDRLEQNRLGSIDDAIEKIEALAGKTVDASGKLAATEMIGKSGEQIAALKQQEINRLLMGNSPMAMRYKALMKERGYDIAGFGAAGGNTMSSERASKFKVER